MNTSFVSQTGMCRPRQSWTTTGLPREVRLPTMWPRADRMDSPYRWAKLKRQRGSDWLGTSGLFYNLISQITFLQRSKARSRESPETNESSSMWKYESRESEHCQLSHVDCAVHTLDSCKVHPCEFPLINQANIRSLSWADFLHLHLFKKVLVVNTQSLPRTSPWKGSSVIVRWVLQSQEHEEKSGGNLGKWMLEKLWGTKRSRWKKNGGISDSAAENYVSSPQCLKNSVKNFSYFEVVLWLLNWAPLTRFHPENCVAFGWIWKVS